MEFTIDGGVFLHLRYIVVWKRVKGEWKYDMDIWNPDHLTMIKEAA